LIGNEVRAIEAAQPIASAYPQETARVRHQVVNVTAAQSVGARKNLDRQAFRARDRCCINGKASKEQSLKRQASGVPSAHHECGTFTTKARRLLQISRKTPAANALDGGGCSSVNNRLDVFRDQSGSLLTTIRAERPCCS
jgi:hypothetical protein